MPYVFVSQLSVPSFFFLLFLSGFPALLPFLSLLSYTPKHHLQRVSVFLSIYFYSVLYFSIISSFFLSFFLLVLPDFPVVLPFFSSPPSSRFVAFLIIIRKFSGIPDSPILLSVVSPTRHSATGLQFKLPVILRRFAPGREENPSAWKDVLL